LNSCAHRLYSHEPAAAPELTLPTGFAFLSEQQSQNTWHPEASLGNQALKLLMSAGFVLPHLQQLPWFLEAMAQSK
jgi:hypothetical protein